MLVLGLAFAPISMAFYGEKGTDASASGIVFEGATEDESETTLRITDPTQDNTFTILDLNSVAVVYGTVASLADIAANQMAIAIVTDAASATDCTVGGNTAGSVNVCMHGLGATSNWLDVT